MALKDVGVRLVVEGTGKFKSQMAGVERQIGGIGSAIAKNRKAIGVGLTAMGAGIAAAGAASIKMFSDFEAGMREVASLVNLSEDQFEDMSKQVRQLSADLGIDAVNATKALYQTISAGIPGETALEFLEIASKAAIAGVTDTETAVDGLTTVINAFKIPLEDTQKIADIMFQTVKGGKTTFAELSASMSLVAPIAATLGVSFEDVSATVATLTKQGTPTSVAMTQIRAALIALTKPSKEMSVLLEELGFETGEAALQQLGFAGTMQALTEAADGNNQVLAAAFGRIEGLNAALGVTGENAVMAAADLDSMSEATEGAGAATEAFNVINEGAGRQFATLSAQMKEIGLTIGQTLLPIIKPMIETFKNVVAKVTDWIKQNPGLTKTILTVVAAVAGLAAVLGPILLLLPAIGTAFTILTGPIGIIIAAIAGLIAVGVLIKKNWEKIATFFKALWEGMKRVAMNVFKGIATVVLAPVIGILEIIAGVLRAASKLPVIGGKAKEFLGGVEKALATVKSVTFFAEGGVSRGGPAVVGERGPEMVSLPPGAIVQPAGDTTNFNVEAHYTNPQEPQSMAMDLEALRMFAEA